MDKQQIEEQIRDGEGTFKELHDLAQISGSEMADDILKQIDTDAELSAEDARKIIHQPLVNNHAYISRMAVAVIGSMYQRSGLGIKALVPAYNISRENDLVRLATLASLTRKAIEVLSFKVEDDSIRENVFASENLGLEPRVTRIYHDVGVHNGKDVCQWCLDRCGEDMPYSEAYAKGAFQRHPGCGCELLYKVGKRVQRQSDWTTNQWEDVNNAEIEKRKEYNVNGGVVKYDGRVPIRQRELLQDLTSEYNTRLKEVTMGAKNAAGEVTIDGGLMKLSDRHEAIVFHEFAHTLANSQADKYGVTHDSDFWKEIKKTYRAYRKEAENDTSKWISSYEHSSRDIDEFMAEAFTEAKMYQKRLDVPDNYNNLEQAQKVLRIIDKYFKK